MYLFIEQSLNGLAVGSIYALITLGLALVYGILGVLHVAHAGIYTVGAYIGYGVYACTGSLVMAILVGMVACSCLGVLIERFIYFPLLKFPPYVPLISSIALFMGMEEFCRLVAGPSVRTFSLELPFPELKFLDIVISPTLTGIFAISATIFLVLWFITTKTELGLAMRATSQDMDIASSVGIDGHRIIDIIFILGSAIAAVAGILVGIYYNEVYPAMGTVPAYKSLALIVVGGLGSVQGAVIAALLLGIAETLLIGYANIPLPRDALAFIAMIAVLLWRPQGLFGKGA
ncbi:MAG: branched-chain amino acid ABC transporter permease [Synergistales bacterium]|nr:branched-chain amino acid ABC transporter permease [Synergistales bacterium]